MVVGEMIYDTDVVVIGGGPGGYTAAIRAADLGREVMLVESRPNLGGVCLTEGCIPSKTLIHAVNIADKIRHGEAMGIINKGVAFDPDALGAYIGSVVNELSAGVGKLVANRDIEVVQGHARFIRDNQVYVDGANTIIRFSHAVIATGSRINRLPKGLTAPIWTSAQALEVPEIPDSLLVIGGGYIGLEIGQAYAGLGSRVTLVEFAPKLLAGADKDLVQVVVKRCKRQFEAVHTDSRVTAVKETDGGFRVDVETKNGPISQTFSKVLAATGRRPNTDDLGLEKLGIETDEQGLIPTDSQCRTARPNIYAIGDVASGPALAHKAAREGKVAAEVIAGQAAAFDNVAVPAVLFTSPEISWTGLTETEAKEKNMDYRRAQEHRDKQGLEA